MVFHGLLTPKILRLTGLDLNRFTENREHRDGDRGDGGMGEWGRVDS
jgi:hypothetical protein